MDAPYQCKYCGAGSYLDPVDQTPPADYCHPEDHGSREDWEAEQKAAAVEVYQETSARGVRYEGLK